MANHTTLRRKTDSVVPSGVGTPVGPRQLMKMVSRQIELARRMPAPEMIRNVGGKSATALLKLGKELFFRDARVVSGVTRVVGTKDPASIIRAYRLLMEAMVEPEQLVAYKRGSEGRLRGHVKIKNGDGEAHVERQREGLDTGLDDVVRMAFENNAVFYRHDRKLFMADRENPVIQEVRFPGLESEGSRLVIPFSDGFGLIDVTGKDLTFGGLGDVHEALMLAGVDLSVLFSLKMVAEIDHLTGLYNRRTFEELFLHYAELFLSEGQNTTLLMLDIDEFKSVNDTYGHSAGDAVLAMTADKMYGTLRVSDPIAHGHVGEVEGEKPVRYGGEEFAVLLANSNEGGALIAARRCAQALKAATLIHAGRPISVTASFGAASFATAQEALELGLSIESEKIMGGRGKSEVQKLMDAVVALCDKALYASKERGRRRMSVPVVNSEKQTVEFETHTD
ncbi:MAG: GGDEF domain-containing protein [Candidatus Micrarchaeota archaeon]